MPLKCDVCGRFISSDDIDLGLASRTLLTPDSEFTSEEYETLCRRHSPRLKFKQGSKVLLDGKYPHTIIGLNWNNTEALLMDNDDNPEPNAWAEVTRLTLCD